MSRKAKAIFYALIAAVFYAVNVPLSKLLMNNIAPTFMAALLYLGAGLGMALTALLKSRSELGKSPLDRRDMPFVIDMIVLDIAAPVFLMTGINIGTSSNASLLGNFEIVATALIAVLVFKESVSRRLWLALALITLAGVILSFDFNDPDSLKFSYGSIFVLLAASCWGLENNCTRMIASKNTFEIVILKGIFSGAGSLVIALSLGERVPALRYIVSAMLLGFIAYGLSIFFYVKAQNVIGASQTSAYYAASPFIGSLLSFVILNEELSSTYIIALFIMSSGALLTVIDTLILSHNHEHTHVITYTYRGIKHTHTITHSHLHSHYSDETRHNHIHKGRHIIKTGANIKL